MTDRFFQSADGSNRCRLCSLHPDTCTCDPVNPMHEVLAAVGWGRLRNSNPSMLRDLWRGWIAPDQFRPPGRNAAVEVAQGGTGVPEPRPMTSNPQGKKL